MEIKETCWLEDFVETSQAILEDAVLLAALAAYESDRDSVLPQTLRRLSDYLSQHAWDLRNLEKRLGLEG